MIVLQNESIVKYYLITIMEELELIYNTPNISALTLNIRYGGAFHYVHIYFCNLAVQN